MANYKHNNKMLHAFNNAFPEVYEIMRKSIHSVLVPSKFFNIYYGLHKFNVNVS